jgi:quercetin dioxygenase-like cupin family protein
VRIVRLDPAVTESIGDRPYEIRSAHSAKLAEGDGEAHVYLIRFEPGGIIGPHEAGFGQLFIALDGEGWAAGKDGERMPLAKGQAAFITCGEVHSKGSETGMTALMIQVRELDLFRRADSG